MGKVGFVSLGCPKALVDSENILTSLRGQGYEIVSDYDAADVVVVNTCGFIDEAKQESLDAIGEAIAENGKVIVTGCLGAKQEEILQAHPKVLSVTGPQQTEAVVSAINEVVPPTPHDPFVDLLPPQGIKLTPKHYAYLKISEGCNHKCSFCIIPSMRGKLRSRPLGDVMEEAERLVESGVKELLVISQDTSAYGIDIKQENQFWRKQVWSNDLYDLSSALSQLDVWVRLHYVYPYPHVDEIIPLMAEGKILPYIDVPFQHASYEILKKMKRPASSENTLAQIQRWRAVCPELAIRSTFIVGFPGETEEHFEELLSFIREAELDRVGCFKYSPVEGAKANELDNPVPEEIKQERWDRFMELQQEVSENQLEEKIGKTLRVLVDEVDDCQAVGRSYADAPEIDGVVNIRSQEQLSPGEFVDVLIEEATEYDLEGCVVF